MPSSISRICLLVAITLLTSCTSVASLAETLDKRHVQSCVWAMGSYGPFVGVHLVSATGGATIAECLAFR